MADAQAAFASSTDSRTSWPCEREHHRRERFSACSQGPGQRPPTPSPGTAYHPAALTGTASGKCHLDRGDRKGKYTAKYMPKDKIPPAAFSSEDTLIIREST
ncbi:Hypothetical predicted protein [Lynx pardinus]|uniref:Uncharacterized protein n=1 Tax=Lynx pardinus TaxID=191816 RepID=A0A485P7S6_LYNPA|nr:Hypothetical predicted protein [Lynx pardinus]